MHDLVTLFSCGVWMVSHNTTFLFPLQRNELYDVLESIGDVEPFQTGTQIYIVFPVNSCLQHLCACKIPVGHSEPVGIHSDVTDHP